MRNIRIFLILMAIMTTQQVFSNNSSVMSADSSDHSCSTIADACLAAGFVKTESADKGIWHDCMRPVILGKTVPGVTIDSAVVKSCRMSKIKELKMELNEFQKSH